MRGIATEIKRSMNSHIRSPRMVTFAPMAWFSRNLNEAIAVRDLVTIGFWPEIAVKSATAPSINDAC